MLLYLPWGWGRLRSLRTPLAPLPSPATCHSVLGACVTLQLPSHQEILWHRSATCHWFSHVSRSDLGVNPSSDIMRVAVPLSLDMDGGPSTPPVLITQSSCSEVKCGVNEFLGELSRFSWQTLLRESWVITCWEENWIMFSSTSVFLQSGNPLSLLKQIRLNYKVLGEVP